MIFNRTWAKLKTKRSLLFAKYQKCYNRSHPQLLAVVWMVKVLYIRTISAQILQNRLSHRLHLYLRNGSTARSFFFLTCCCTTPAIRIGSLRSRAQCLKTLCEKHAHDRTPHVSFHLTQLKRSAMSGNTCAFRNVKETKKVNRESCAGTKYAQKKGRKGRVGGREARFNCNAIEKQFVKLVHMHTEPTVPICPHHQLSAGDIHQDKEVSDAPNVLCGWHYKI